MVTLQVLPYAEIEGLTSVGRIRKLLNIAKENKIVLLQGRLRREEEAELIRATMEEINNQFKGIELAVVDPHSKKTDGLTKLKNNFANFLLGDRAGLTVIGPATIVKQIKRNPNKIELLMSGSRAAKKKRRK